MVKSIPTTLRSYQLFCDIRSRFRRSGRLEIDADFVYPTTLLPLAVLISRTGAELQATNAAVRGYSRWILNADLPPSGGSYVPLVRLPRNPRNCQDILRRLQDLSLTTELFSLNRDAYQYLLSELVDNIYEHAQSHHAYVMAQSYPAKGLIETSFMDDGVTIVTSLADGTGRSYRPEKAYQAILDALSGRSAKAGGERGYGLSSSVRLVNALGGEALVVSGRGAVVSEPGGEVSPFSLPPRLGLDGTLVSLRIPESKRRVNLYSLVEG